MLFLLKCLFKSGLLRIDSFSKIYFVLLHKHKLMCYVSMNKYNPLCNLVFVCHIHSCFSNNLIYRSTYTTSVFITQSIFCVDSPGRRNASDFNDCQWKLYVLKDCHVAFVHLLKYTKLQKLFICRTATVFVTINEFIGVNNSYFISVMHHRQFCNYVICHGSLPSNSLYLCRMTLLFEFEIQYITAID